MQATLLYISLIGGLRYLTDISRSYIAFVIALFAKYLRNPSKYHMALLKHVLQYLQRTKHFCLLFRYKLNCTSLQFYADLDFAESHDRKFRAASDHIPYDSTIQWCSKKQSMIALSSCEVEYISASHMLHQTIWLRPILYNVDPALNKDVTLSSYSQATIKVAENRVETKLQKFINPRPCHLIQEITTDIIKMAQIAPVENCADCLTKATPSPHLLELSDVEPHISSTASAQVKSTGECWYALQAFMHLYFLCSH